jgi:hypothetical protein
MGKLRERIQYLKIEKKSHRLSKDSVRVLSEEPNNAKLRKEKDRDEKRFKISASSARASDNILFISNLKMF